MTDIVSPRHRPSILLKVVAERLGVPVFEVQQWSKRADFPPGFGPNPMAREEGAVERWLRSHTDLHEAIDLWARAHPSSGPLLPSRHYYSTLRISPAAWHRWTGRSDFPAHRLTDDDEERVWDATEVEHWIETVGKGLPAYWVGQGRADEVTTVRNIARRHRVSHNRSHRWSTAEDFPSPTVPGGHLYWTVEVDAWVEQHDALVLDGGGIAPSR